MIKHFVSALMLAAMVSPAAAADVSAPLEMPASSDWSGFYIGGHLGGGKSIIDWTYDLGGTADHEGDGVLGGA